MKLFLDSVSSSYGFYYKIVREIVSLQTAFQKAEIVELELFGKSLILDGKIQSTLKDEFIYHEALVHPAMLSHPSPERVCVIGGGEGATLREVLKHRSVREAVMVDIDEEVVRLCEEHLPEMHGGSFKDKRVKLFFEDGRKFLEKERDLYDVIIMDSTDPLQEGPSYLLFTVEFFQMAKSKLSSNGVIVVQSNSACIIETDCFTALNRTMREVFPDVRAYSVFVPSFGLQWGFNLAGKASLLDVEEKEKLDEEIKKRIHGPLKFLSGDAIRSIFSLPKMIQEALVKEERIIRDSKPLYVI